MRQLNEIQNDIETMETAIKSSGDSNIIASWTARRDGYEREYEEAKAYWEAQERVQAQEAEIELITLPYDYNDILGNPIANETIVELLQQSKRQSHEDRNELVDEMNEIFKKRLDELTNEWATTKTKLQTLNSELQNDLESERSAKLMFERLAKSEKDRADQYQHDLYQLGLEKQDAESKRNNAVEQLETYLTENIELKAQILALQQEVSAKKAVTVSGNEKLSELAAKAKESTAAAAQRGIDRWNKQHGWDIPTIVLPELDPVSEEVAVADTPFFAEEEVRTAAFGLAETALPLSGEESEVNNAPVTRNEFNGLIAFVNHLSNRVQALDGAESGVQMEVVA